MFGAIREWEKVISEQSVGRNPRVDLHDILSLRMHLNQSLPHVWAVWTPARIWARALAGRRQRSNACPHAVGRPGMIVVVLHTWVFSGLRLAGWTAAPQPAPYQGRLSQKSFWVGFMCTLWKWGGGKEILPSGISCWESKVLPWSSEVIFSLSKNLSVRLMGLKIACVKDAFFLPTVKKRVA